MVSAAWQGASDSDLVALVHDAARTKIDDDTQRILDNLAKNEVQASLVLNKIDLVEPERLLARAAEMMEVVLSPRSSDLS